MQVKSINNPKTFKIMNTLTLSEIAILSTSNVKDFYINDYADDEYVCNHLNPHLTFLDILLILASPRNSLYENVDLYDALHVGDSLMRERIFAELARLLDVEYDEIYNLWVNEYSKQSYIKAS